MKKKKYFQRKAGSTSTNNDVKKSEKLGSIDDVISMMRFLNYRASHFGTLDFESPKMGRSSNKVDNKAKEASVAFTKVRWDGS